MNASESFNRANQRFYRVALCGPAGRHRVDGCASASSVVGMGRLCGLRRLVDWFCCMVKNPPMTDTRCAIVPCPSLPAVHGILIHLCRQILRFFLNCQPPPVVRYPSLTTLDLLSFSTRVLCLSAVASSRRSMRIRCSTNQPQSSLTLPLYFAAA